MTPRYLLSFNKLGEDLVTKPGKSAKMNIFGVVFGILCTVLVSKCEDRHHIGQRVLADNNAIADTPLQPENSKTDIPNNPVISNKSSPSASISVQSDPSEDLEQKLDALAYSKNAINSPVTNNETVKLIDSPQGENKTLEELKVFPNAGNSPLLRADNLSTSVDVKDPVFIGVVANVSTNAIQAPKVFPNSTSINGTKIVILDSAKLQTLISPKNRTKNASNVDVNINQTAIDTEVKDLLNYTIHEAVNHQHPLEPVEAAQMPDKIQDETEFFEDGKIKEDSLRHHKNKEWVDTDQRYLAAILVCSLVAASVLCYAALIVWRRYLENRYGSRTMLVNEEEFDDPSDLRHFSI